MSRPARRISPEIILFSGLLIALITSGPRVSMGLFQLPVTAETGWGRDVFSLAIALQNLLWGLGQPFAGGGGRPFRRRACSWWGRSSTPSASW
jgi:hypothetical protein